MILVATYVDRVKFVPGYLRDVTGSYTVCFLCMGTCMVIGGLPMLLVINENQTNPTKLPVNAENNNRQGDTTMKG